MFKTTRGLVLREVRYKEADRILTVLTQDEGKITAKARGALRSSSRLAAGTQSLAFSDMTLFGNKGRWTVNEASPVELFSGVRCDIEKLALATYIAEALETVSDEDCPNAAVLQLGLNSLYALSSGVCPAGQIKAVFELRLMCLSGYEPELSACAGCGREDAGSGGLQAASGEFYCADCLKAGMLETSAPVLAAMRHIVGAPPKRVFSFSIDDRSGRELGVVCERYMLIQLDRTFGSLEYYKKIIK